MKNAILVSLAVFMVASFSFGAETNISTEVLLETETDSATEIVPLDTNEASLSLSNKTVMVETGSTNVPAKEVLENPVSVEASKYKFLWQLLFAVLTPLAISGVRRLSDIVPKQYLAVSAPIVGIGIEKLIELLNGLNLPAWDSAIAGLAGVGIYEAVKELWIKPRAEKKLLEKFESTTPASKSPDQPIP